MSDTGTEKHVDFFIVGAPKAGTSSLYHYLNSHSEIVMADPKEPNYFSRDETRNLYDTKDYRRGFTSIQTDNEYHALFNGGGNNWGECSVSYLFFPDVPERIKKYNSEAKIIICLRNPVDRAFSHYDMDWRLGYTKLKMEKALQDPISVEYQQYISVGMYADQVSRYIDLFGKEKVQIIMFEDIKNYPDEVSKRLCEFLGVSNELISLPHRNKAKESNSVVITQLYKSAVIRSLAKSLVPSSIEHWVKSTLFKKNNSNLRDVDLESRVYKKFEQDITKLESKLGMDLSSWRLDQTISNT